MTKIPKAYQKGFVDFLNCKIDLSQRVLIPRVETKYWVEKVIKEIKKENKVVDVLDIFSGSGCIGIAILKNIKEKCKRVDFSDIDSRAIKQIKINLDLNKILEEKYKIYQSSFFQKINKKYDLILANPPYVAQNRIQEVGESVLRHEPSLALFSGEDGMDHIKKFLEEAKIFLKKDGHIYLEFDPRQKGRITKILENQKYSYFRFYKDQFKKYRFIKIKK